MKFTIKNEEKYSIFELGEEKLDTQIAPSLKSEFVLLNSNGVKNIILNLVKVRYTDSSGLSSILVGNRLCKTSNGTFVITCMQEPVRKLINISQLDSVLNITHTVNEAKDLILMEELERDVS